MSKRKKQVKLANIPLMRLVNFFYGKIFMKTHVKLCDDGTLSAIEPPYLLLSTHGSPADVYSVPSMLLPKTASSFIVSYTQYTVWGNALKWIGGIYKKQFSTDYNLIKDVRSVLDRGRPFLIYPEAKFSIDGTNNQLPSSCAKLAKMMKAPLVVVQFDGSYLYHPKWSNVIRKAPVIPNVKVVATAEELKTLSVDEIHNRICDAFRYDDYKWQRENKISIKHRKLVEGLESILHQCPHCGKRYVMTSRGDTLTCSNCGYSSQMDEYGVMSGKFSSVPEWYNWIKVNIANDIETKQFAVSSTCRVLVQRGRKYKSLGNGIIVNNDSGITIAYSGGTKVVKIANGTYSSLSCRNTEIFLPTESELYRIVDIDTGRASDMNVAMEIYNNKLTNK